MIAKIAVSAATYAIDKPYSYRCDAFPSLRPGHRVIVPFGRGNRATEGVVLSVESADEKGLKAVERCLDEEPVLDGTMLHLAAFLRQRCFCTFYDAIRVMLPAGLWFQTKQNYTLAEGCPWEGKAIRQEEASRILSFLQSAGGEAEESALQQLIPEEEKRTAALHYLLGKKWVVTQRDFLRRTGDKTEQIATIADPAEEAMAFAASRPKSASMQKAVLELLCSVGTASMKDIYYYTGAKPATVRRLEKLGFVTLSDRPVLRCREILPVRLEGPLVLNAEQQAAFDGLYARMQQPQPGVSLLHGVTGSGKTSVYIALIRSCLEQGKSSMLLVPEIALTPQLLSLLAAHFGQRIAVLHSSLGAGERYDQWKRIRDGEARVVIGTRSAVFAPCRNLGLIVLDEEQEHTYKSENNPRYSARDVAIWRGSREKALVLLGSATPSVESMYRARTGVFSLFTLNNRYNGKPLPHVDIVDMKQELRQGNDSSCSDDLMIDLEQNWKAGNQSIFFINRRGNSRALVCVDCRQSPQCPRCSSSLTYHSANDRMMCHYCGYQESVPKRCPHCGGPLKQVGTGTQKLEQELKARFPELRILRMDADTISAVNTHEKLLRQFQEEKIPLLLGTQMIAKGLNLPDVTLVGVFDAELSLFGESYRAAETTFNLLAQVVGRAGRGEQPGRAVIQTLAPDNQVIRLAAMQDYEGFYNQEIQMRRVLQSPPFGDIGLVTFSGQDEARVIGGAVRFRDSFIACLRSPRYEKNRITVLGPAPCPVLKVNLHFRHRLTVRGRIDGEMRRLLGYLLQQFMKDGTNRGVTPCVDVNGFE